MKALKENLVSSAHRCCHSDPFSQGSSSSAIKLCMGAGIPLDLYGTHFEYACLGIIWPLLFLTSKLEAWVKNLMGMLPASTWWANLQPKIDLQARFGSSMCRFMLIIWVCQPTQVSFMIKAQEERKDDNSELDLMIVKRGSISNFHLLWLWKQQRK